MTIRVATRKGLFTVDKTGGEWKVTGSAFLGDPVTLVLTDRRDGASYAALRHGHFGVKLHRQNSAGGGWEEITAPAFPPRPEDAQDRDANSKEDVKWVVDTIWALAAGGDDAPGELWCGTIPGGLFHSRDGGRSWSLVRSLWDHPGRREWFGGGADLPGIHSICVDPRDSSTVRAAVSCGGIWRTTDRGESWQVGSKGMIARFMPPERAEDPLIQDPHSMVQCCAHPDRLWVQHHNGIFTSDDAGESWRELEGQPSSFGFAVAAHPHDPKTAWFVPAIKDEKRIPVDGKLVVSRTRDGGQTFEVLRSGLPQEHAYDLVFRHALDVDDQGSLLAFGSTTGALFVSEDGGGHWHCVNAHLPPIYAVRIG